MGNNSEIIIYQSEDGLTHIDVKIDNETVWLTLDQMATLFDRDKSSGNQLLQNLQQLPQTERHIKLTITIWM